MSSDPERTLEDSNNGHNTYYPSQQGPSTSATRSLSVPGTHDGGWAPLPQPQLQHSATNTSMHTQPRPRLPRLPRLPLPPMYPASIVSAHGTIDYDISLAPIQSPVPAVLAPRGYGSWTPLPSMRDAAPAGADSAATQGALSACSHSPSGVRDCYRGSAPKRHKSFPPQRFSRTHLLYRDRDVCTIRKSCSNRDCHRTELGKVTTFENADRHEIPLRTLDLWRTRPNLHLFADHPHCLQITLADQDAFGRSWCDPTTPCTGREVPQVLCLTAKGNRACEDSCSNAKSARQRSNAAPNTPQDSHSALRVGGQCSRVQKRDEQSSPRSSFSVYQRTNEATEKDTVGPESRADVEVAGPR